MTIVELRDRDELASFFRRRPAVHAYELGDLDDFFWPHTRWFGWRPCVSSAAGGPARQLATASGPSASGATAGYGS